MSSEQTPDPRDATRAAGADQADMAPGDEAAPGADAAGENLCRTCGGAGEVDGRECPECGGTGRTTSAVSAGA